METKSSDYVKIFRRIRRFLQAIASSNQRKKDTHLNGCKMALCAVDGGYPSDYIAIDFAAHCMALYLLVSSNSRGKGGGLAIFGQCGLKVPSDLVCC